MPEIENHDVRRIFYYMVPRDIKPSFVVNVSDVKDKMVEMIRCHESQLSIHKGSVFVEEMLMKYREVTGLYSQTKFSEAFVCEEVLKADVSELFTL
jgi:LmbE family N-acetylglucosaminyl deacetylase